jgi:protein-disulfide isomerase
MDAAMLARCAGDTREAVVSGLLAQIDAWGNEESSDELIEVVSTLGMPAQAARDCLKNKALLNTITAARTEAEKKLGMRAYPVFLVNGELYESTLPADAIDKALAQRH